MEKHWTSIKMYMTSDMNNIFLCDMVTEESLYFRYDNTRYDILKNMRWKI